MISSGAKSKNLATENPMANALIDTMATETQNQP